MRGSCKGIEIKGIVSVVPGSKVSNLDYVEQFADRRIKKQIKLTGIESRRVCSEGQTSTDLAIIAARSLLEKVEWDRDSISVLVYVTQSPELSRPATAFIIQQALGIGQNCLVYDINMGCTGYIGGLETVAALLNTYNGRGLLLVGESHAREDGEINTSTLLVGDAASATALECSGNGEMTVRQYSDGNRANLIHRGFNKPGFMDGNAVLLFGLNDVVKSVKAFKDENHLAEDDIDYYVFHQAQKMIVDGIAQGAGLPENKVLMSCGEFGNTSSASIPLTLSVSMTDKSDKGLRILMCGFGIGLSWGIVYTTIRSEVIYPLIESDDICADRSWY